MILLLISFPLAVWAKDLGVHGQLFPIQEQDLLQYIQTKLHLLQKNGELQQLQQQWLEHIKQTVQRPPAVKLPYAQQKRSFIFDPSITLKQNLMDDNGNIISPRGSVHNPLDTMRLTRQLIFIDGDNLIQIQWALKTYAKLQQQAKIILTNGSPLMLNQQYQIPFYFDQGGYLIKKLGIQALPSIVKQQEKLLLITEVALAYE